MEPSTPIPMPVKPMKTKQLRPFRFDERAKRKWSAAIMQMVSSVSRRKTIGPEAALAQGEVAAPRPSTKLAPVRRRSFPALLPQLHDHQALVASAKRTSAKAQRSVLVRSRSLTVFGDAFFRDREHFKGYYRLANDERKGGPGIDFEILQRCQRPQYATQLHWYHRFRRWKKNYQGLLVPALKRLGSSQAVDQDQNLKKTQVSPLSEELKLSRQRSGKLRSELIDAAQLQIPNQQVLRAALSDFQSKVFIKRVKQMGKAWDLVILLVSAYHLVVTPFKVCFSHAVTELAERVLIGWSNFEVFLDLLCFVDLVYRIYHASPKNGGLTIASTRERTGGIRHALTLSFTSELRIDILAMLPMEMLLLGGIVRLPNGSLDFEAGHALWWTTRWLLRVNRMLLVRRIQPLSEELFQFAIHDLQLPVTEELLYFLRSMASYMAMGHILACIWFITSEVALWRYGVSWLSTPGMLPFRTETSMATDISEAHRALSEAAPTFTLDSVSLAREYLRSLLFSLECISTLFYGDIISMNPMELIAEIVITFWSIYIYGALVGAQGEWIDSQARQEAAFEQNLGELQRFLNENDVPKGLKRQVKAYYARMWRRHQGKPEFASVANVSKALYEDVVFATQHDFAAQVRVFRALDENFLRGLLVCLDYVVCSEGEEIVTKGDMDRSMYFIAQGRILVRMDSGESMRERGEFFGEFALLYGISRLETCMALSVCRLSACSERSE